MQEVIESDQQDEMPKFNIGVNSFNKVLKIYIEGGELSQAQELFRQMIDSDAEIEASTCHIMMNAYFKERNAEKVIEIFTEMELIGITPNTAIFSKAIQSCVLSSDLKHAMLLYNKMRDKYKLTANRSIYQNLLKICHSLKQLKVGKQIYDDMVAVGVASTVVALNLMISIYAKCLYGNKGHQYLKDCIDLMKKVEMNKTVKADSYTFSAMIKLCMKSGLTKEAIKLLENMKSNNIERNFVIYNMLTTGLCRDTELSDDEILGLLMKLLDDMEEQKNANNVHGYNGLVNLTSKLGDNTRLATIFDTMKVEANRTHVSKNALLKQCHDKLDIPLNGDILQRCFDLVAEMESQELSPNNDTYLPLLAACARASDLERANQIWNKMIDQEIKHDVFHYNAMIETCRSCQQLNQAVMYFKEMKEKNIKRNRIIYRTLIECYQELGTPSLGKKYLQPCFVYVNEMKEEGFLPDHQLYACLINACAKVSNLKKATEVWDQMIEQGLKPKVVHYGTMLKACLNSSKLDKAIETFQQMKAKKVKPTVRTYAYMLRCHEKLGDLSVKDAYLKASFDLVKEMERDGLKLNSHVYTSLLNTCAKAEDFTKTMQVWDKMADEGVKPNAYHYAPVIRACVNVKQLETAIHYFTEMKQKKVKPAVRVYAYMMRCFEKLRDPSSDDNYLQHCFDLLKEMEDGGLKPNRHVYAPLLGACASVADFTKTLDVWEEMIGNGIKPSARHYGPLIRACLDSGKPNKAIQYFKKMKEEGVKGDRVVYRLVVICYDKLNEASGTGDYLKHYLGLITDMEQDGLKPNRRVYVSLLNASAKASNITKALEIWETMADQEIEPNAYHYGSMLEVCLNAKRLDLAIKYFKGMKDKEIKLNLVIYGLMMKCYEKLGDPILGDNYLKSCFGLVQELEERDLKLDLQLSTSLLNACSKTLNLSRSIEAWDKMIAHGITPNIFHYTVMIKLCLDIGIVDQAMKFFDKLKGDGIKPNSVVCSVLLEHFSKTKDQFRAKELYEEMKILNINPDKSCLKILKKLDLV